jgi:hypothetical protein
LFFALRKNSELYKKCHVHAALLATCRLSSLRKLEEKMGKKENGNYRVNT